MPQPNGYRKALRFMKHADHFGFPILTFVDTPGAYAGKAAEEQGQVGPCNVHWGICLAVKGGEAQYLEELHEGFIPRSKRGKWLEDFRQ